MSEETKEPREMTVSEFDEFCVTESPERIIQRLKLIVQKGEHTDCQNLDYFQTAREHFDAKMQDIGTVYEKRFQKLTQQWLRGDLN